MSLQQRVIAAFNDRFDTPPTLVARAPGRVNLIGEHTDYNDGFVLPMAIDGAIYIALRPREDRYVVAYSLDFDGVANFSLDEIPHEVGPGWTEYVKGVAWSLQEAGHTLHGWDGMIGGDVPIGAGLSSSAALEVATARAFAEISQLDWDAPTMAKVSQKAENEWVGMKSGIMDQMISAAGEQGSALLIDCRSLETESVKLPPATSVVILDTMTRRELVGSAYNERREQCEAAARHFGVPALRDVTLAQFTQHADELDDVTMRRARHVITENLRVLETVAALKQNDPVVVGRLMNTSHVSMRDDFEISRDEMNAMVECAQRHVASYGARMTGGGFGGCAVALVQAQHAEQFADEVSTCYTALTKLEPNVYICNPAAGATITPVTWRLD